jgi:hypothetical protein
LTLRIIAETLMYADVSDSKMLQVTHNSKEIKSLTV